MALGGGGRAGRKLGSGPEDLQRLESADLSWLLCRSVTWGLQVRLLANVTVFYLRALPTGPPGAGRSPGPLVLQLRVRSRSGTVGARVLRSRSGMAETGPWSGPHWPWRARWLGADTAWPLVGVGGALPRESRADHGLPHPAAVQEERQRGKDRNENEVESTSSANEDMPVEKILEAELAVEPKTETYVDANMGLNPNSPNDPVTNICQAADKQLFTLVEWAKRIPHFSELPLDDQVILLRAGWNELLIASFSHRSIAVKDGILLATGLHVHRNSAHSAGVGAIFDRVLTELVSKMRDMQMDKTELGCLRAIVLFNPDSKGLSNPAEVEALREKVYASLEAYCKHKYPEQPGRFAKLLLRLPALRSIGLKCLEHLFFFKLIGDTPIDTFLMEMLEAPHQMT
uniref:retinoic acid receptor RXR-alpha n=1 Tax=Panthera onca TaxID=9690 RepID=UPI0029548980|nr:retinoic acid receptor RXR-alpha [Panthera onca]